jgi:methyltransferase
MVAVHVVWFIGMVLESTFKPTSPTKATLALTALLFFLAQILRLWTMSTLGRHWNITVWAPPDAAGIDNQKESPDFVHTGPYRYIRHPNYLVVMIEFITLPIMGGAYLTAALCSVFNLLVLWRRIQVEEKYLFSRAGYRETMGMKARFIPGII